MHHLAILSLLLAPLAIASPAEAGPSSLSTVTIHDSTQYRGQERTIPVNGICVDLGPPFTIRGRGVRSLRFENPSGENCELYYYGGCRDNGGTVTFFESQPQTYVVAASIRCAKNARNVNDD